MCRNWPKTGIFRSWRSETPVLGGPQNVLYNTWLAGSIADAFRSVIAFFKNRQFFGVFGAFLAQP